MRSLVHRAAGWHSAQALYSNRTARTIQNSLPGRRRSSRFNQPWFVFLLIVLVALFSTVLLSWSLFFLDKGRSRANQVQENVVSRIAFGSSSAHDYGPQPVWVDGVIPSDPHVWIWVGNMVYLDEPRVNCEALPSHAQCNCSANWLQQPPHFCMAGNLEHAISRMQAQLANPDYAKFLAFMCPGHRTKGLFPPPGSDPEICPRSILGTYNDHDYSWRQGNKRLPQKDKLKQVFLDAIGEPVGSPRRNHGRGIEWKYTLNEGIAGHEIDVILLDTRYYRDTLPCYIRRPFCEEITKTNTSHDQYAWCRDFLSSDETGSGSCCDKDEKLLRDWCMQESSKKVPHWNDACSGVAPDFHAFIPEAYMSSPDSPFCEMLGKDQRNWLENTLLQSKAPLKLLVSSSVVLGKQDTSSACRGDDWECYKPAQLNLLKLASEAPGCVLFLTGGSGYSDIRVLRPGETRYEGFGLSYPLYQVMASGLTTSTSSCNEVPSTLDRPECHFVGGPSFGMIEVESHKGMVKLQIRDGTCGQVKLERKLPLQSCN